MIEQTLWAALRAIQERINVLEAIAGDEKAHGESAETYERHIEESRIHVQSILNLLKQDS